MNKKNKKWMILGIIAVVVLVGYNYYKKHPDLFSSKSDETV